MDHRYVPTPAEEGLMKVRRLNSAQKMKSLRKSIDNQLTLKKNKRIGALSKAQYLALDTYIEPLMQSPKMFNFKNNFLRTTTAAAQNRKKSKKTNL